MRHFIATAILIFSLPFMAEAAVKPLVADVATGRIEIDSTFNGTSILLFGAASESGDLLILVRGPERKYIVRKKRKIGGIWVNADEKVFPTLPSFFLAASSSFGNKLPESSRPFTSLPGEFDLFYEEKPELDEFSSALLEKKIRKKLIDTEISQISFMGDMLFRVNLDFPASISRGVYTAEVYLINDQRVLGVEVIPIVVLKTGLDAFIYDLAHRRPNFYGIISIILALAGGYAASRLFQKNNI